MDKNFNLENAKNIIAEVSGVPVNTTFGSITKPIDLLLEIIDMSADLIALIREETELKKHHRAYLHVHEELEDCADEMAARMQEIFDETTDCVIGLMKDVHETFRVRKQEAAEDDADTVTIAKEDYEDPVALVCNEEGKLEGLPLNRALRDEDGDIYDVVAGTFMVVGLTDDSFGSLTVEQMQKFSDLFRVPEQFVKLGDKIVAIPMISKEQQQQESIEQKDFEMNADTSGLTVAGHIGTWHTIDQHEVGGHSFYLMEHDTYGDEAACIIVDERGKLVLDDVYNGFDDDTLRLLDLEVKEVPEMPDPALTVQDMKDYGYAWAGVLPAGQEAAEKALEKGCEVYRLYSDNTEGLCVDAKEIAAHAAKDGMLGISKESWMAALEKENYLKAAEMSMEDDYGMIDGIINNGPKEDKTLDAKAPERGEKSSIMDRLKSAKAEKQKECCPPKKHKGEIEL